MLAKVLSSAVLGVDAYLVAVEVAGTLLVVYAIGRRWWGNAAMAIHIALPNRYFDQLGIPRLAA